MKIFQKKGRTQLKLLCNKVQSNPGKVNQLYRESLCKKTRGSYMSKGTGSAKLNCGEITIDEIYVGLRYHLDVVLEREKMTGFKGQDFKVTTTPSPQDYYSHYYYYNYYCQQEKETRTSKIFLHEHVYVAFLLEFCSLLGHISQAEN